MFSVLIQKRNGHERLIYCEGDIEWDGSSLYIDDREILLAEGDRAFVMNADGQTVQKYGRR